VARPLISASLKAQVRKRAGHLCEYCHTEETWQYVPFTIDHVEPLSLGGSNSFDNLALACFHCNRCKSNALRAFDPETGEAVNLFNPRQDSWAKHFIWSQDGLFIIALTATGRATLAKLDLNRERILRIRAEDKRVARHPPKGDPVKDD
jgi:hypothetical protein